MLGVQSQTELPSSTRRKKNQNQNCTQETEARTLQDIPMDCAYLHDESGHGGDTDTSTENDNNNSSSSSNFVEAADSEMALLKSTLVDTREIQHKRTSSSGASFSELSFVTASQQQQHHDDHESEASSITSRDNSSSLDGLGNDDDDDLEAQHNRLVREQFLPAPGHRAVNIHGDGIRQSSQKSITVVCRGDEEDQQEQVEEDLSVRSKTNDPTNVIPVIAVSNVQLLAARSLPTKPKTRRQQPQAPQPQAPRESVEEGTDTRSIVTTGSRSSSSQGRTDDDQQSVTSVQSLISVVAELISLPLRVFQAVLVNLEHEISMGHCPARAAYLSATVVKEEAAAAAATGSQDDNKNIHPDGYQESAGAPLGLQLDCTSSSGSPADDSSNRSLVISAIDPNGPWTGTPFCVGDRLISMNHVPISDWDVRTVHDYWNTLEDASSVTLVVHNPHQGNAQCVEAMVTKPEPSSRTGLGMRSSRLGRIKISRVDGLFADSLLNAGDQIVSINGQLLDGYNSAQTAQLILQSPRYVSVVAKTDPRNAFVISSTKTAVQGRLSSTNRQDSLLMLAAEGSMDAAMEGEAMNRDGTTQDQHRRPELDPADRCENCGTMRGPWTTLRIWQWVGNLYVLGVLVAGLYFVFSTQADLALVTGVLVVVVIMANMINVTIRRLQQQQQQGPGKNVTRCSTCQLTCNIIVITALTLMLMLWRHYDVVTAELILILSLIGFAPMMVFINLSLFMSKSVLEGEAQEEEFDYEIGNGEHEAVASLAGSP